MPELLTVTGVRDIEHVWIPLQDGTRLSARIWLPTDAEHNPVPAVLEYLPYRKDDATVAADAGRHPYFAAHGYASIRVDIRGTGSSEGICLDEYLPQEQLDAVDVIAWIADQPWCSGSVGMIGYSWGGFNGLQVAARRPPALKAVISGYSTDDRYTDDCHYQGGCLLASDMLKWATWMHALNARPPDPRFVGEKWRSLWLERLQAAPPFIEQWMSHPTRDEFWKQGSVREDYRAIDAAVLLFGGLADPYRNTIPRLLDSLECPRAAIIGPWAHVFPSHGVPGPQIGFLDVCVAWFDRWLKGIDNHVDTDPAVRIFVQDTQPPDTNHHTRTGRWVSAPRWPTDPPTRVFRLTGIGALSETSHAGLHAPRAIQADYTNGAAAGVWCPNGLPDEMPADQNIDDDRSLTFESEPVDDPLTILGRPRATVTVSVNKPVAHVAARVSAVAPNGDATLLSYGLVNLTHTSNHERVVRLVPGRKYPVHIDLGLVSEKLPAGYRLRLAISPAYWPHAWPSPQRVTLTVHAGHLTIPLLPDTLAASTPAWGPAIESHPVTGTVTDEGTRTRHLYRDGTGGVRITDETTGTTRISATGTDYREVARDTWWITADDPASAEVECIRDLTLNRDGWATRVVTTARQYGQGADIVIETSLEAYEADQRIFREHREHRVARYGY